ncbi:Uncharacterized protein HZ326_23490 [Fusarium oxysporum f. sp. albedinis]|nr:Uncharacterized protein HZ326_23490 [Fusarium oxysporum f. sp. albedinis]
MHPSLQSFENVKLNATSRPIKLKPVLQWGKRDRLLARLVPNNSIHDGGSSGPEGFGSHDFKPSESTLENHCRESNHIWLVAHEPRCILSRPLLLVPECRKQSSLVLTYQQAAVMAVM